MGRVVFVTGCSVGGIGYDLCKEYARAGCTVYATARKPERMAGLEEEGCRTLQLDIVNYQQVEKVISQVLQEAGSIDLLVNNAGAALRGPITDVHIDTAHNLFEANYWGHVAVTKAVVPHMISRGAGTVVNVGSVAGYWASPFLAHYSASKAALQSFSDALRVELKPFGVQVMHVTPGFVHTKISEKTAAAGHVVVDETGPYGPIAHQVVTDIFQQVGRFATQVDTFAARLVRASLAQPSGPLAPLAWLLPLPRLLGGGAPTHYLDGTLSWPTWATGRFAPTWAADIGLLITYQLFKLYPTYQALFSNRRKPAETANPEAGSRVGPGADVDQVQQGLGNKEAQAALAPAGEAGGRGRGATPDKAKVAGSRAVRRSHAMAPGHGVGAH